jgi:hypothetical protein
LREQGLIKPVMIRISEEREVDDAAQTGADWDLLDKQFVGL